jgi:hypothetical protein
MRPGKCLHGQRISKFAMGEVNMEGDMLHKHLEPRMNANH